jgi:hypothetical protein
VNTTEVEQEIELAGDDDRRVVVPLTCTAAYQKGRELGIGTRADNPGLCDSLSKYTTWKLPEVETWQALIPARKSIEISWRSTLNSHRSVRMQNSLKMMG